jgi:predicted GNAT family acetyltransferase
MTAFRDNAAARQYELDHAGGPSFARYRDDQSARAILHVETPAPARAQGHAARLMEAIAADARAAGVKLTPVCGYARAWFKRHQDAGDVLA